MRLLFQLPAASGQVVFSWAPSGNYLATSAAGVVHVWDRHGEHCHEVALASAAAILAIEWDKDGECLAVLQEGQPQVAIWNMQYREVTRLDTGLKDPSFMKWSGAGPQLVVGTCKGSVLVYNRLTRKKVPVLGKHPRKITCGAWSSTNKLALGSEDCTLTLSNDAGDTVEQTELKHAPTELLFATQKTSAQHSPDGHQVETHLSINMGGQSLLLYDLNDPDNPLELAFQQRYGKIVRHEWFGDGFMMLGFSEGFLVVISTHISEIGEELFSGRFHHKALFDIAYSPTLKYAAVAGELGVKLVEMHGFKDLKREAIATDAVIGAVDRVKWSPDGQILTASTRSGVVLAFLARMPIVHASAGTTVAYLSSLKEISVVDTAPSADGASKQAVVFGVSLEPAFVSVGPAHVAVGMNNLVVYYRYARADGAALPEAVKENEQEYLGKVDDLCMNARHAAVLCGGRVTLHDIAGGGETQLKTFPDAARQPEARATAIALTHSLLVYGTNSGSIEFFSVDPNDWSMLDGAELRHVADGGAIRMLRPNGAGTRVAFVDAQQLGFVYNPVSAEVTPMPSFPTAAPGLQLKVMWDTADKHVLLVSDGAELHTYAYAPCTIKGATVTKLGPVEISADGEVTMVPKATPIQQGLFPICSHEGAITCQVGSGSITSIRCPLYEHKDAGAGAPPQQVFCQCLALLRLHDAWDAALHLSNRAYWFALSGKAMEVLDLDLAVRVYRQLGDAGMVMGLERISHLEDKNLLAGHVLLLFSQYAAAQDLFLLSSRPVAALEMRRDLLHWDQALKLAHTLDAAQEPFVSVEYAQQLEFRGDNEAALGMFESAMRVFAGAQQRNTQGEAKDQDQQGRRRLTGGGFGDAPPPPPADGERDAATMHGVCVAGVARCTLRLGDVRRGLGFVKESGDKSLCRDCAAILEGMDQFGEAAALYELAELWEKAAAIYIRKLDFVRAALIMPKVALPKLHAQYGRACEQAGKFVDAAKAYEVARDMDAVVRLYLGNQLNRPEKAFEIVRATASSDGAQLVARFCQQHGDIRGAIEFLLMARQSDEAFDLAKAHSQVDVYAAALGEHMSPDDALQVAQYYEKEHDLGKAGKYHAVCGQYARALKLFIQCGDKEVHSAIEIVGKARSDALTHTLIDFLMGEPDGVPKDPNHIYRLYIALGNYAQAAKTAVIISRQEQELGNYRQAHAILYETTLQLEAQAVHVPQALRKPFILLHSYMLVRRMIKRGDHASAARMLLRVARNISKFPAHAIQLLTSTVVECQRAGLKQAAYDYASMLMRPEHRGNIEAKFKKKIEAMIRRPNLDGASEEEPLSACPVSGVPIPQTDLECPTTKEEIPMCVVTGRHMERSDWCICPNSKMPALYSQYRAYVAAETRLLAQAAAEAKEPEPAPVLDPVCSLPIRAEDLQLVKSMDEVQKYLEAWAK
ncbi:hypothetical protein M885DRAFT_538620 [Pelagophyceae sp. CCMP2097]|nr:hypothetical protein M885DRAFT_538620 [Pelagophyceae sp. CCMP2097]